MEIPGEHHCQKDNSPLDTKTKIVFTAGVWDLFHIGHLEFLRRAKALGDKLVVGVMTDVAVKESHGQYPIIPFAQRMWIIEALGCVDRVGAHRHPKDYWGFDHCGATIRAIGPQYFKTPLHQEAHDELTARGIKYVEIPRTPNVSTTEIKEKCYEELKANRSGLRHSHNDTDYQHYLYRHLPEH